MRRIGYALVAIVGVALGIALAACAKEKPPEPPKAVSDHFEIKVGAKVVRMQLAIRDTEQEQGLMGRRDLGPDDGMLFVYLHPQQMHYWMHNTPTPLDIGFFDEQGVLREFYPMEPFDETTVSSRSREIKYALEMHQGWYSASGVKPGAQIDLKAVASALKERGFDPRKYGLEQDR